MYRIFMRILAVALALCLCITGAAAELRVDTQLASLLDKDGETDFSLGIHINQLYPFGQETLDMLNETLEMIRVESRIRPDGTRMGFSVAGESLLSLEETRQGERMQLVTDLLPNRVLVSDGSPMDMLSGNENTQEPLFDLYRAIDEAETRWQGLADAIVPYATEKKAGYKIARIGSARWVRLARLSQQDSGLLLPQIIGMLECGMDASFRESLAALTCADGFTVALYSDKENGTPMALYMKGTVYLQPEQKWTLAYQWAFVEDETQRKDTYRYELSQTKSPRHKRVIEGERIIGNEGDTLSLTRQCKLSVKDDVLNQTITQKDSLTALSADNRTEITGKLETTVKDQSGKESLTTVTTIVPQLALADGILSGSASLARKQGKADLWDLVFTFDAEPALSLPAAQPAADLSVAGSSLAQNTEVFGSEGGDPGYLVGSPPIGMTAYTVPQEVLMVDLDSAEPQQKAALLEEMAQNAAGALLIALGKLPGEPLALLTDLMTDADYQTFLSLLGDL